MITPQEVLEKAIIQPEPEPYFPLEEYGETLHILFNDKKMTWREIKEWFSSLGMDYSIPSFSLAYQKWVFKNPNKVNSPAS